MCTARPSPCARAVSMRTGGRRGGGVAGCAVGDLCCAGRHATPAAGRRPVAPSGPASRTVRASQVAAPLIDCARRPAPPRRDLWHSRRLPRALRAQQTTRGLIPHPARPAAHTRPTRWPAVVIHTASPAQLAVYKHRPQKQAGPRRGMTGRPGAHKHTAAAAPPQAVCARCAALAAAAARSPARDGRSAVSRSRS